MTQSQITILVTGANGQLGMELKALSHEYHEFRFIWTDIEELDITNKESLNKFFGNHKIDGIINCAAYTAVDKAESDDAEAFRINSAAVKNLVDIVKHYHCRFIHISTDYVFDGTSNQPYKEDDKVNPVSIYGKSKLAGEQEIIKSGIDAIIIRTSWLYSAYGNNFVKTILRIAKEKSEIGVVFDQTGNPTYAHDLAKALLDILQITYKNINSFKSGIYNFSNEGVCSWYDFATEIITITNLSCKIVPIETSEFSTQAKRPQYSVLNKKKIRETFNIEIPHWRGSLENCIRKLS
ncbi:MAG: dTDP-4-dehydrorhamnose reductase [Bacteroidia bacterium]|nr:dTDP-4-dehydrorhamnose reductase [Bacteroidia bacterium]